MKNIPTLLLTTIILCFFSCSKEEIKENTYPDNYYTQNYGNPQIKNKVYQKDGRTYLWAGQDSSTHFDITDWSLNIDQLHFGLGREHFKALLAPAYIQVDDDRIKLSDNEKCIFVRLENGFIKVFPYQYMLGYEVINELVDGEPIMIAYCVLADLAAAYTRNYCDKEITFAVSGYTYFDPQVWGGLDGFILWDRDTESLWWPLIDKAVSGSMKGVKLKKFDENKWNYITWGEVKITYPDALILQPGQTMEPPSDWDKIPEDDLNCN